MLEFLATCGVIGPFGNGVPRSLEVFIDREVRGFGRPADAPTNLLSATRSVVVSAVSSPNEKYSCVEVEGNSMVADDMLIWLAANSAERVGINQHIQFRGGCDTFGHRF